MRQLTEEETLEFDRAISTGSYERIEAAFFENRLLLSQYMSTPGDNIGQLVWQHQISQQRLPIYHLLYQHGCPLTSLLNSKLAQPMRHALLELLLKNGLNCNQVIPFINGTWDNQSVELLIEAGLSVNEALLHVMNLQNTEHDYKPKLIALLLDCQADPVMIEKEGHDIFRGFVNTMIFYPELIQMLTESQPMLLIIKIWSNIKWAKYFYQKYDTEFYDNLEQTVLREIIELSKNIDICQQIALEQNHDKRKIFASEMLFFAIYMEDMELFKKLLSHCDADINYCRKGQAFTEEDKTETIIDYLRDLFEERARELKTIAAFKKSETFQGDIAKLFIQHHGNLDYLQKTPYKNYITGKKFDQITKPYRCKNSLFVNFTPNLSLTNQIHKLANYYYNWSVTLIEKHGKLFVFEILSNSLPSTSFELDYKIQCSYSFFYIPQRILLSLSMLLSSIAYIGYALTRGEGLASLSFLLAGLTSFTSIMILSCALALSMLPPLLRPIPTLYHYICGKNHELNERYALDLYDFHSDLICEDLSLAMQIDSPRHPRPLGPS